MEEAMSNVPTGNCGCRDIGCKGFDHIALIGCSRLGRELASLISFGSMKVHLCAGEGESASEAVRTIGTELGEKAASWILSEAEAKALAARITPVNSISAIPENVGLVLVCTRCSGKDRGELLTALDQVLPAHVVIASFLGADRLEAQLLSVKYPERFLGFRMFPPVWDTTTAEVIPGDFTSKASVDYFVKFLSKVSKQALKLDDRGGHLSVRAFLGLVREAAHMCDEPGVSAKQADEALRDMLGMRLGPLELADRIGLPIVADWCRTLAEAHEESRYDVPPLLQRNITSGRLGFDSGAGFLDYTAR
jgi:3-hydroxybutyryl-CoA dehydrogenase